MAKYTLELRELFTSLRFNPPLYSRETIEGWFKDYELSDYLTSDEIDVITETGIWSKDKLAKDIVDHYYMRELGFETPALFKHYAKIEMQELMEEYLPLIYSASIKYDPLINVDYTETFSKTDARSTSNSGSGTNSSVSSNSASSLGINSDTPQGNISKSDILAGRYASSTGSTESSSSISDSTMTSTTNSGSEAGNEAYTKNIKGNSGISATYQKMIEQYRNNIRAINREIIKKLNYLFMGLY